MQRLIYSFPLCHHCRRVVGTINCNCKKWKFCSSNCRDTFHQLYTPTTSCKPLLHSLEYLSDSDDDEIGSPCQNPRYRRRVQPTVVNSLESLQNTAFGICNISMVRETLAKIAASVIGRSSMSDFLPVLHTTIDFSLDLLSVALCPPQMQESLHRLPIQKFAISPTLGRVTDIKFDFIICAKIIMNSTQGIAASTYIGCWFDEGALAWLQRPVTPGHDYLDLTTSSPAEFTNSREHLPYNLHALISTTVPQRAPPADISFGAPAFSTVCVPPPKFDISIDIPLSPVSSPALPSSDPLFMEDSEISTLFDTFYNDQNNNCCQLRKFSHPAI